MILRASIAVAISTLVTLQKMALPSVTAWKLILFKLSDGIRLVLRQKSKESPSGMRAYVLRCSAVPSFSSMSDFIIAPK